MLGLWILRKYWGDELFFVYAREKYMIQGYMQDKTCILYFFKVDSEGIGYDWIDKGTNPDYSVVEWVVGLYRYNCSSGK